MTVYALYVDQQHDLNVDVDDIASWCQASALVHNALEARSVSVSAERRDDLQVSVDGYIPDWVRQVVND